MNPTNRIALLLLLEELALGAYHQHDRGLAECIRDMLRVGLRQPSPHKLVEWITGLREAIERDVARDSGDADEWITDFMRDHPRWN